MTSTRTPQQRWEAFARSLPNADSFEQNAEELGYVDGTDEFYEECLGQAWDPDGHAKCEW